MKCVYAIIFKSAEKYSVCFSHRHINNFSKTHGHTPAKRVKAPQLPQTMSLRRSLAHAKHGQAPDSLQLTVNHLDL